MLARTWPCCVFLTANGVLCRFWLVSVSNGKGSSKCCPGMSEMSGSLFVCLFVLTSCLVFTFVTIQLFFVFESEYHFTLLRLQLGAQNRFFWCQDFDASRLCTFYCFDCWNVYGTVNFFPIPVCAMCCCGLISLQLVATTEIATNNQDTVLLVKILCNCLSISCVT